MKHSTFLVLEKWRFTLAIPEKIRIKEFVVILLEFSLAAGLVELVCRFLYSSSTRPAFSILVTIFDELFRSEGVQQVYGIVTEWLAGLDESERKKIK